MEMVLTNNFSLIETNDLLLIDGGINWGMVWNGLGILGGFVFSACLSIALTAGEITLLTGCGMILGGALVVGAVTYFLVTGFMS